MRELKKAGVGCGLKLGGMAMGELRASLRSLSHIQRRIGFLVSSESCISYLRDRHFPGVVLT